MHPLPSTTSTARPSIAWNLLLRRRRKSLWPAEMTFYWMPSPWASKAATMLPRRKRTPAVHGSWVRPPLKFHGQRAWKMSNSSIWVMSMRYSMRCRMTTTLLWKVVNFREPSRRKQRMMARMMPQTPSAISAKSP